MASDPQSTTAKTWEFPTISHETYVERCLQLMLDIKWHALNQECQRLVEEAATIDIDLEVREVGRSETQNAQDRRQAALADLVEAENKYHILLAQIDIAQRELFGARQRQFSVQNIDIIGVQQASQFAQFLRTLMPGVPLHINNGVMAFEMMLPLADEARRTLWDQGVDALSRFNIEQDRLIRVAETWALPQKSLSALAEAFSPIIARSKRTVVEYLKNADKRGLPLSIESCLKIRDENRTSQNDSLRKGKEKSASDSI